MDNIPLAPWNLPSSLAAFLNLTNWSASNASITGMIPDKFASLSHLANLSLSHNNLTGHINIVGTLLLLALVQLRSNRFTGPIPDVFKLSNLQTFDVANNYITGIIPRSLTSIPREATERVPTLVIIIGLKYFGPVVGPNELLLLVGWVVTWMGNNPWTATGWLGVHCDAKRRNVTIVDFSSRNISGSTSSHLADLTSLSRIIL
uniref:Uncharacterized protein n=1 Tax=Ananas comosus var. bracteatus TaxID=296719 RepID=A0A6V7NNV9_ANACO|nr:unnamed protein product [Ananas comosus var. bracteatus]